MVAKQMAQKALDSDRVIRVIENVCITEIGKIEEVVKAQIRKILNNQSQGRQGGDSNLSDKDVLMIENEELRDAMIQYDTLMDAMKNKILSLSSNIEENKFMLSLHSSEERKNEKERFLKIIKDFEQQRGDNLSELEKTICENQVLRSQIDKLSDELEKITKKFQVVQSQAETTQKVLDEQIRKKREMLQENKEQKSLVSMLHSRVDTATKEINKLKASYNQSEAVAENKDLKIQLKALQEFKNTFDQENEVLKKENSYLKKHISEITTNKGEDSANLKSLTDQEIKELQTQEIKEVNELQSVINSCVEKILTSKDEKDAAENTHASQYNLEEVKNAFSELRQCQDKLFSATKRLQLYNNDREKQHMKFQLFTVEHENKLLKLQLSQMSNSKGSEDQKLNEKAITGRMWTILKKARRLYELSQNQEQPMEE